MSYLRHQKFDMPFEVIKIFSLAEAAIRFKPLRMGEVPQGDTGEYPRCLEPFQKVDIAGECRRITAPFFRFDAAPLDTETVRLMTESFEQFNILFVKFPAVARFAGWFKIRIGIGKLLMIPLAVDIIALDLVPGSGTAPDKIFREGERMKFVQIQHVYLRFTFVPAAAVYIFQV